MECDFIAHVRKNEDGSWAKPHSLTEHLIGTSKLSRRFSEKFNSGGWGEIIGLLHDLGKGRKEWQEYLRIKSGYDEDASLENIKGKLKHAIYGAKFAEQTFNTGRILAYSISGHHTGIPDWSPAGGISIQSSLQLQYQNLNSQELSKIDNSIIDLVKIAKFDEILPRKFEPDGVDFALWIRMLYSTLVDADFLDTESYMDPNKSSTRGGYKSLSDLDQIFDQYIKQLESQLETKSSNRKINQMRKEIRLICQKKANSPSGIFSLTVPTGGGKTLSSLSFAMEHAKINNMDRIIYVIPYTSIIEQNANVFKNILGSDQVVEHHSNIDSEDSTFRSRLATENWDAPIIVTTSVQFFESLFSAKPSKCRKLHNIVNSIVILDEAQLLPIKLLQPILNTMNILSKYYNVTFIISTATQPAFKERDVNGKKFEGLQNVIEIMDDIEHLEDEFKRVEVQFPSNFNVNNTWEEIAEELKRYKQVLCIVSDRESCRKLYELMPQEGKFHLSALMCGEHRSKTIEKIKKELDNKSTVRVISTQLIEAGVDIDFPIVYRSMAGLDSIAQASGRCNREGSLKGLGKVFVFNPPTKPPVGILRRAEETSRTILMATTQRTLRRELFDEFFSELYWKEHNLDSEEIIKLLTPDPELAINFRTASEKFKIVDDRNTKTILVRYGKGVKYIDYLKDNELDRQLMRKLQRYTVNIRKSAFYDMLKKGSIEEIKPNIYALSSEIDYSEDIGLVIGETIYDPDKFMV